MALSNAERQRRYVARLKEKAGVTNEAAANEFTRLKAFADQLERENAALKEKLATVTSEAARLKGKLADAKRREGDLELELKLRAPKSAMTAAQFSAIRKCLHPDTIYRLRDEGVTKQFSEAFKTFNGLRSRLVK